jgi:hypothetical protein
MPKTPRLAHADFDDRVDRPSGSGKLLRHGHSRLLSANMPNFVGLDPF